MRCLNLWCLLFYLMLGAVAQADPQQRALIANISGSERLRMFAFGKLLETGSAPRAAVVQMKQNLTGQGFYYGPGTKRVIATEKWVGPVLRYDGNINGGVLQDSFTLNGFVFDAAPDFKAKAGGVAGLSGGAVARVAWANGRYAEARISAEGVWSPEHRIGRSNAELALCSRNHLRGWTFVDLCHSISGSSRALASSLSQDSTLSITQLFQMGNAYHELTAELAQAQYDIGDQASVKLTWGAVWNKAATKLSLTRYAPVPGETALQNRVAADVQWRVNGRSVGVGVWHQRADGGAFLGQPRSDTASGISVTYQLRPGTTAQIGYMVNHSSVDFFDHAQASVNLRFEGLRW